MLNISSYKEIIISKLKTTNGFKFQDLFWEIASNIYDDFEKPKQVKDQGNDGYSLKSKLFFACYGPEEPPSHTKLIKKMLADFNSFDCAWAETNKFSRWIFVTKFPLTSRGHKELIKLNSLKDGITKEIWTSEDIFKFSSLLELKVLLTIFNLPDHVLYSSTQTIEFWPGGSQYLNLDNVGILRNVPSGQEGITLALNHVPYEMEKPKSGEKIVLGDEIFQFGDEVKDGEKPTIHFADAALYSGEILDKFTFRINDKKTHVISIGNRKFRITLISVKQKDKPNVNNPLEYKFSISEEI